MAVTVPPASGDKDGGGRVQLQPGMHRETSSPKSKKRPKFKLKHKGEGPAFSKRGVCLRLWLLRLKRWWPSMLPSLFNSNYFCPRGIRWLSGPIVLVSLINVSVLSISVFRPSVPVLKKKSRELGNFVKKMFLFDFLKCKCCQVLLPLARNFWWMTSQW